VNLAERPSFVVFYPVNLDAATADDRRTATLSRSSSRDATMARIWSLLNVVWYTSRLRARSIASVGSPCTFPRRTWNLRKSRRMLRFLL
jgi:hypothetical protein